MFLREKLYLKKLFNSLGYRNDYECSCLTIGFKFYTCHPFHFRGVVFARNVVPVVCYCQGQSSGLTTMLCVRPANITAALRVACAANLPTQLSLCSPAAYATGLMNRYIPVLLDVAIICRLMD